MNDTTSQEKQKPQWGPILKDLALLMCVMGLLGYACNFIMKQFENVTPVDSLTSLIRKGDMKSNANGAPEDSAFLKELQEVLTDKIGAPEGVNTPDRTGRTPLMWAVYANFNNPTEVRSLDLVRLYYVFSLLNAPDIAPKTVDQDGFSALHWAAWSGMPLCSAALVQAGLDINARENNGYTPLMLAAMRGNAETVEMLLSLGADPSLVREDGSTALSLAQEARASYDKRSGFFYTLIYSDVREASYDKAIALFSAPVRKRDLADLRRELEQAMLRGAVSASAQVEKQDAEAQEKQLEHTVEKAAGAPPDTTGSQAPSEHIE